jgi:hypothetical protein
LNELHSLFFYWKVYRSKFEGSYDENSGAQDAHSEVIEGLKRCIKKFEESFGLPMSFDNDKK